MKFKIPNTFSYEILIILLFVGSPLLSLIISILIFFSNKFSVNKTFLAIIIALGFGYIAYHTVALESDDLYRHYEIINSLENANLSQIFKYGYPGVAINTFIMYLCSIIGLPSLYPFLLISLGFFLILTIFNKIGHKIPNNESLLIFIFVFLEMFPRYYFSGLRNHFVFIILTCLILHYYLNKCHRPMTFQTVDKLKGVGRWSFFKYR